MPLYFLTKGNPLIVFGPNLPSIDIYNATSVNELRSYYLGLLSSEEYPLLGINKIDQPIYVALGGGGNLYNVSLISDDNNYKTQKYVRANSFTAAYDYAALNSGYETVWRANFVVNLGPILTT